jgi:hypothetical protein
MLPAALTCRAAATAAVAAAALDAQQQVQHHQQVIPTAAARDALQTYSEVQIGSIQVLSNCSYAGKTMLNCSGVCLPAEEHCCTLKLH